MRRYFIFNKKKCRIYAAFGVSQTPKVRNRMKGAIQMSNLENYMKQQAIFCEQNDSISKNLYSEYGVKRGLRDEKGQGVLTGLRAN